MQQKSLRIAVADDEVDMRDFLRKVLPRMGHQVVAAAENGTQLLAECRGLLPDLVITDLKMPGGDGVSAIQELWQEHAIPVIVISAYAQEIPAWLSSHPLLTAVLVKPIKTTDLEPVISQFAASHSAP